MQLSFQTVCIVFGVTLVHLLFIAALSPVEIGPVDSRTPFPEVSAYEADGEMEETPVPAVERRTPTELPADFFDWPAQRREEVSVPSSDSVAESGS